MRDTWEEQKLRRKNKKERKQVPLRTLAGRLKDVGLCLFFFIPTKPPTVVCGLNQVFQWLIHQCEYLLYSILCFIKNLIIIFLHIFCFIHLFFLIYIVSLSLDSLVFFGIKNMLYAWWCYMVSGFSRIMR